MSENRLPRGASFAGSLSQTARSTPSSAKFRTKFFPHCPHPTTAMYRMIVDPPPFFAIAWVNRPARGKKAPLSPHSSLSRLDVPGMAVLHERGDPRVLPVGGAVERLGLGEAVGLPDVVDVEGRE